MDPFQEPAETEDMSESENETASKTEVNLDTNLLLASLLEEKCSLFVQDPKEAHKLFEELCTHLSEYGVLSHESYQSEFSDSRNQQMDILKEIMKTKAQDMLLTCPEGNECAGLTDKEDALINTRYRTDFEEFERLGKGGFGSVFRVKHKLDGSEYAVKKIRLKSNVKMTKLLREVRALATMKHRNIVGYNAAWKEHDSPESDNSGLSQNSESQTFDSSGTQHSAYLRSEGSENWPSDIDLNAEPGNNNLILYIQMELCSYNLQEWLSERNMRYTLNKIDIEHANMRKTNTRIFRDILSGVHFIHTRGLIHRDLKPQNIFLTGKNQFVKIGDFGLAKDLLRGDSMVLNHEIEELDISSTSFKHTKRVGTLTYASPEQLAGPAYDRKSDIYSLGVILFEMYNIFDTEMERLIEIMQLRRRDKCSETFRRMFQPEAEIIESLVNRDAMRRPLASEILKHKMFRRPQSVDAKWKKRR